MECSYPVASRLSDVFSDLLGRETKRTNLGSQSGRCTNLATSGTEVAIIILVSRTMLKFECRWSAVFCNIHDLNLVGVDLGSYKALALSIVVDISCTLTHFDRC